MKRKIRTKNLYIAEIRKFSIRYDWDGEVAVALHIYHQNMY